MFKKWYDASNDFPIFGTREKKIELVELQANEGRSCVLAMCCPMEGYPADKDLRTHYEWAKAWNKKRYRELGLDAADWSETDKDEDSREDNAGFHDEDILPVGCWKGTEEDNTSAEAEAQARQHSRTPPTAKKASVNSEAEPRRKRHGRHRRIAEVGKIISRVRAGAETMQLIRPDGESADLDRTNEELINVCIEHPHVRSVELQPAGPWNRATPVECQN